MSHEKDKFDEGVWTTKDEGVWDNKKYSTKLLDIVNKIKLLGNEFPYFIFVKKN